MQYERKPHEYRGLRDTIKVCKTFMRRFDPGPRLQTFLDKINIDLDNKLNSRQADLPGD